MNVKNHSYRTRKSRIIREVVFSELKVNCRSVVGRCKDLRLQERRDCVLFCDGLQWTPTATDGVLITDMFYLFIDFSFSK